MTELATVGDLPLNEPSPVPSLKRGRDGDSSSLVPSSSINVSPLSGAAEPIQLPQASLPARGHADIPTVNGTHAIPVHGAHRFAMGYMADPTWTTALSNRYLDETVTPGSLECTMPPYRTSPNPAPVQSVHQIDGQYRSLYGSITCADALQTFAVPDNLTSDNIDSGWFANLNGPSNVAVRPEIDTDTLALLSSAPSSGVRLICSLLRTHDSPLGPLSFLCPHS